MLFFSIPGNILHIVICDVPSLTCVFINIDDQKLFLESEVEQTSNIVCLCAAFMGPLLTVPDDCSGFSLADVLKCFQFYGWEKLELEKKQHICSKEKYFHLCSQEFVNRR